ncbi:MAG: ATP-binding protein [Prevotellaceae bacterium]|nr:ATP-binding protein [Prevotellaceae bacterium]
METSRILPIGIQDFEYLRTNNYLYVDKTAYIYRLATTGKPYFLSRPRRFGKSLFLSTLKAYFQGKKELFEGLAIVEREKDWIQYPVFHLDMNVGKVTDVASFMSTLNTNLRDLEQEWGKNPDDETPAARLDGLIKRAHRQTGRKVVVLIDEYDKPLLDTIDKSDLHELVYDYLGGFYAVLKSADAHLRFLFLTGITKFAHLNVFSQLNQLDDISMQEVYAGICGITEEELLHNFQPELHALAKKNKQTYPEAVAEMKKRYDGYHFAFESPDVYNPFSVLNVLNTKAYRSYWFKTGTPTALVKLVRKQGLPASYIERGVWARERDIEQFRVGQSNLIPFLYQSGYLTIKEYDDEFETYTLGFPNKEVMYGFYENLILEYAPASETSEFMPKAFLKELYAGDVDSFMNRIRSLFASVPYSREEGGVRNEDFYQSVLFLLFRLLGQYAQMEQASAQGRADLVVTTPDTIYVFEFKMMNSGTAEDALKQINDKGYAISYATGTRKVVKVGAEFSEKERTVNRWLIEP